MSEDPISILKRRLALGEISIDEYNELSIILASDRQKSTPASKVTMHQDNPAITDFKVSRGTQFSDQIALEYPCVDKSGNATKCLVRDCWGYVQNNTVFIAQGTGGYFFRLHIIGALIHYYAIESYSAPYYDYSYGYPTQRSGRQVQTLEYLIEFETGKKIVFNYKNFSAFLLEKDKELYDELQKTRKKRKMIYHFLIRYNEKHPVYFYKL